MRRFGVRRSRLRSRNARSRRCRAEVVADPVPGAVRVAADLGGDLVLLPEPWLGDVECGGRRVVTIALVNCASTRVVAALSTAS